MSMMQWFVNEVRGKFAEVDQKIQAILDRPVIKDNEERISKLEGEIKAMKARMGKSKE